MTGWGHGHGLIVDTSYRIVRSVEPSCTYQASSDMHEFYLIDNGRRALMTQYVRSVYDFCPYGSCDGLGYIHSGVFQEVDVESGACVFGWNSIDHVGVEESYVPPGTTEISGNGESPEMPWDYFHINSVDKSSFDGGYLISGRHVCAVYKVDGTTGEILWRLGGKKNDYEFDDSLGDVAFGYQHDARWISDSPDESVISLFDNASNGFAQTASYSSGKIIRLDHVRKVAMLVERPLEPPWVDGHTHSAHSQGNFQLNLPGFTDADIGGMQVGRGVGNRIMSFGNDPFFAEYAWKVARDEKTGVETGEWETVFYGALAWGWMMNYRVLKYEGWEGVPLTKPALWAYSQHGMNHTAENENTMALYVSWNGHTKIDTWTFYGTNTEYARRNLDSPDWQILSAGFKKNGFETIYMHQRTFKYMYVEAFDAHSVSLGKSLVHETFTPNELMAKTHCDELACEFMDTNNPEREAMVDGMKQVYDNWMEAKENNSEIDIEDVYKSVHKDAPNHGGRSKVGKIVGFGISFFALSMLVIAVFGLAVRRYSTVQVSVDKVIGLFGMKMRREGEGQKGKYFGVQADDGDIEEEDAEMQRVATRSSDNDAGGNGKKNGLEAERQTFWRSQSP